MKFHFRINELSRLIKNPMGILLIAGLVFRILLYIIYQPANHLDEVKSADALQYHISAKQLVNQGKFLVPDSEVDVFRTPGYPIFIYCIYKIWGIKPYIVLFMQIFINLASVYVLYSIVRILFNNKVGIISALLFNFEPDHLYYTFSLLTETPFVFIILSASLSLVYYLKRDKLVYLIVTSLLTGIATLIRPIAVYFPLILVLIIGFYQIHYKKSGFSKTIKRIVTLIFTYVLTISPWLIRNFSLYGYPGLTSLSGQRLLYYDVAYTIKRTEKRSIDKIRGELDSLVTSRSDQTRLGNPFYKSKVKKEVALDYLKQHKFDYFKTQLLGMINIYSSMEYKAIVQRFLRKQVIPINIEYKSYDKFSVDLGRFKSLPPYLIIVGFFYTILLIFYYATALGGLILLIKDKEYFLTFSIMGVILYFTILTGVVGVARFRLPISPFYIIFSGYFFFSQCFGNKVRIQL